MRRALPLLATLAALAALAVPAAAPGAASPQHQGIVHDAGSSGPTGTAHAELVARGASLYAGNCSTCHGSLGEGIAPPRVGAGGTLSGGPSLRGVGALAPDFYLRTGYMPLESPKSQPARSRVLFSDGEIRAMVAYIATLGKGPAIPTPHPERGSVSQGMRLFTDNCAGCHQVVAQGGYVTDARVPPLEDDGSVQIAEAVRIGPYYMPRFSPKQITPGELNSIIAYVQYSKNADNRGGWSLGDIGPWPEGMVAWLIAGSLLVLTCIVIGQRLKRS